MTINIELLEEACKIFGHDSDNPMTARDLIMIFHFYNERMKEEEETQEKFMEEVLNEILEGDLDL